MDTKRLITHSLRESTRGESIARIMAAALDAVDPISAVERNMMCTGDELTVAGQSYDLRQFRRTFVIGAGKAAIPMASAAGRLLGEHVYRGLVITKRGHTVDGSKIHINPPPLIEILEAGHPVPDAQGVKGTQRIIEILSDVGSKDLVICLISGGGSALMLAPSSGVKLDDLQSLTDTLLAAGVTINEINILRKHLDLVKGGRLAKLTAPAQLVTLILSDVIGDPLDVIASGPTVPDPSTYSDAYRVLEKYQLLNQVPESIISQLRLGQRGEISETPKPGDSIFKRVQNVIVGNNFLAGQAALEQSKAEGFNGVFLTSSLQGEARLIGPTLAAIARQIETSGHPARRPACVIAGGETTVTISGIGEGGRNQELALSAVVELAGLQNISLVALATDGGDGPTDAAGAVVTGETLSRAMELGLDPIDFLDRNDAYHFFEPLGDLLKTGPTLTNVNDLTFIFAC
jgi:hydroxypyruvate reductase